MLNRQTARAVSLASIASLCTATLSVPFSVSAQQVPPASPAAATLQTPVPDRPLKTVSLKDGARAPRPVETRGRTVADALRDAGVVLGDQDRCAPPPSAPLAAGTAIVVSRVQIVRQTENIPVPFGTVFVMSHDVSPGRIQSGHTGVPGLKVRTYRAFFLNGHQTSREFVSEALVRKPVDQQVVGGIRTREARALPSRGGTYQRIRGCSMVATGYSPYEGSGVGRCATGMRAGYGVVAVDPRFIRLGSRLFIEGYGYAVAGDTGGAIKGHRIDLGHTTYREASNVGRRRVMVWVLSPSR